MDNKTGNYLIVCHCHWMGHKSWHEKTLVGVTKKEADGDAALLAEGLRKDFQRATAKAFLLPDTIKVI